MPIKINKYFFMIYILTRYIYSLLYTKFIQFFDIYKQFPHNLANGQGKQQSRRDLYVIFS